MSPAGTMGAYQPRTRRAAMADRFDELQRAFAEFVATIAFRGAGAVVLIACCAAFAALASYDALDASLNNATGRPAANLLGGLGATGADLLLQSFGLAAIAALAAPAAWGAFALFGRPLRAAGWRALAWPLGSICTAGGLGILPAPPVLPAGFGGLIGLASLGIARHLAEKAQQGWVEYLACAVLLLIGVPLAFIATGIGLRPVRRLLRCGMGIAFAIIDGCARSLEWWRDRRTEPEESEPDESLAVVPEPTVVTSHGPERLRETRVKRDDTRKVAPKSKPAR